MNAPENTALTAKLRSRLWSAPKITAAFEAPLAGLRFVLGSSRSAATPRILRPRAASTSGTSRCGRTSGADHLDFRSVDSFTLVVVGGLGALVLVFWLLGRYYPGSGLEQLGLQSARELTERREELEAEDLDQMLRAHNERRRSRGEREVSAEEIEAEVLRERGEARRPGWPAA